MKKKYLSLKWSIIISILPVVLLITIVVLMMIYTSSKETLINKQTSLIEKESDNGAATIGQWTNEITAKVDMAADLLQENRLKTEEDWKSYMVAHKDLIDGCEDGLYVVYKDGTWVASDGTEDKVPEYVKEDWYNFCISNEKAAFDACSYFEDDTSSGYSVTVGRQIVDAAGQPNGIIAIDAYLDGINTQVAESKDSIEGDILVIDKKSGMVIAGTEDGLSGETVTSSQHALLQTIQADVMSGNLQKTYVINGNTEYMASSNISGTDWIYLVYVDQAIALQALTNIKSIAVIGISILVVLITISCIFNIGKQMNKLKIVEKRIDVITGGDFSIALEDKEPKIQNEVVTINSNLKNFINKMKFTIKTIITASDNLSRHSELFSNMAEELNEDAISESIALEDLTTTIGDMTGAVQNLAENASDLAGIVQTTQNSGIHAGEKMQEVVEASEKGNIDIQKVNEKMENVEESMRNLELLVTEVSNAAEKINSITNVIKSIAEETNLLSLNASIEAARAGEQGRGFAVVADQIKSLASTSGENAKAIEELIINISGLIEKTTDSTKSSAVGLVESTQLLEKTTISFQNITETVYDTKRVLNNLIEDIEKVDHIATDIAAISEEQAASSEEILATTQSVSEHVIRTKDSSQKIKEGTNVLHMAAEDLENEMKFFKL